LESELSLEKALDDLEEIVETLEGGAPCPLRRAWRSSERGIRLVRLAGSKLDRAEQRIESLTGELPPDLAERE